MSEEQTAIPPPSEPAATPAVTDRRLLFHAVASALYALLPIPLLDDHLIRNTRRKMVRELAAARALPLTNDQVLVLSGTVPKSGLGCLFALLISIPLKVVYKLLRRLFRTIFIWLAVNDAVNAASASFHEGYLIRAGLQRAPADPQQATLTVRRACNAVLEEIDTRPFQKMLKAAFLGSLRTMHSALGRLRRRSKQERQVPHVERDAPNEVVDRLEEDLGTQRTYLQDLDQKLSRAMDAQLAAPVAPAQSPEHSPVGSPHKSDQETTNREQ